MKVKLLRKLHKRYDWYFNKSGFPVLIDHEKKKALLYDVEYCAKRMDYKVEDVDKFVTIPLQEWALRNLKLDLLQEWGWDITRIRYRIAVNKLKRKKP
jgi:hypothetical protein